MKICFYTLPIKVNIDENRISFQIMIGRPQSIVSDQKPKVVV